MRLTPHTLLVPWSRKSRATYTSSPPMGRTTCTEPQCLYKGTLYLYLLQPWSRKTRAIPLSPVGRTNCTEPQCLYKGTLYIFLPSRPARNLSTSRIAFICFFRQRERGFVCRLSKYKGYLCPKDPPLWVPTATFHLK